MRGYRTSDAKLMRELIIRRQSHYSVEDAARLLRLRRSVIRRLVSENVLAPVYDNAAPIPWHDLVHVAVTERWTPRLFAEALEDAPPAAFPASLRFTDVALRLPQYLTHALDALALLRGRTTGLPLNASDIAEEALAAYLESISDEEAEQLASQAPSVREARQWPHDFEPAG